MSNDTIARLVDGTLTDPDGDGSTTFDIPVRSIVIADSLKGMEDQLVRDLDLPAPFAIVSDPDTHRVLGARVEAAVRSVGEIIPVRYPHAPHADMDAVNALIAETDGAGTLIAVGSGTINDLCKYAAAKQGKPYISFATAPSMNGYTSVNAAITDHGHKKSLPAAAPAGVFMDLEVLAASPVRMIRSGFGDSVCRATAQVDWLMSDLLLGRGYRQAPFDFLMEDEAALFAEPEALVNGDLAAMGSLARTLVLSGLGMTVCGGSYPASQGEHLISHYIEMLHPEDWPGAFHGEQIAVTTCVMAKLQHRILNGPAPVVRPSSIGRDDVIAHFGEAIGEACWQETRQKLISAELAERLNAKLADGWDGIREQLLGHAINPDFLVSILYRTGAPIHYSEIGIGEEFFAGAVLHARELRNRFTFLDLAAETGNLRPNELI